MKFRVIWLPELKAALALLWATEDTKAISKAADTIDSLLENDPLKSLTPVDELYFLRVDRLPVLCDVNETERTVRVIDLRYYDPK